MLSMCDRCRPRCGIAGKARLLLTSAALGVFCATTPPLWSSPPADAKVAASCPIIVIPEGWSLMGSDDGPENERPQHLVWISTFGIDKYEVTHAQYRLFLLDTGRQPPPYWKGFDFPQGMDSYPVVGVTWEDAAAYCAWAGGRLPTEAEWEKAARGTDGRTYPWGASWDPAKANVDTSSESTGGIPYFIKDQDYGWRLLAGECPQEGAPMLRPVGSYPEGASPWGVLDMEGNASEWVADWYNWGGYGGLPDHDPLVSTPPWNRCFRGSSWFLPYAISRQASELSRCAARNSSHASRDPRIGFRCAYDVTNLQ